MPNSLEVQPDLESEISLSDILEFIQDSWKQLLVAGIIGAALGYGGWALLGSYKAEYILLNNTTNTNTTTNTTTNTLNNYGLDLVAWRTLQKSLPNLANQIIADEKLSSEARPMFRQMSEAAWWSKNIIPTYAISKADAKDLAAISKNLDAASTTILSLNIHAGGDSKSASLENVRLAATFLKTGGAYLQVNNLLNSYEGESIGTAADIQKEITTTEIEQTYLRERLKNLEELHKRFPSSSGVSQQVVDPKDSGAKYLPLTTQIIAVNNDINQNKEELSRLSDRLKQIELIRLFLIEARPLVGVELDGIMLSKALLGIEDKLRKNLPANDVKNKQALDQLRAQLLMIEARFTKGLEANTAPVTKKTGMLKATAGGLVGAGFVMLVFLLGRKVIANIKKDKKPNQEAPVNT